MKGLSIVYREMEEDDVEACIKIRTSTLENYFSVEALAEAGITRETVAKMLNTTHKGWVSENDGELVGFGMGNQSNGEFWVIAVLPEYTGQGIGRRLAVLVQEWLFTCHSEIWLWTSSDISTQAYHLYTKLGWVDCGIEQGARIMKLSLPNG